MGSPIERPQSVPVHPFVGDLFLREVIRPELEETVPADPIPLKWSHPPKSLLSHADTK
jgi:hypothetical protein